MALTVATLVPWLSGCSTGPRLDTSHTAMGQDSRAQFLILHYTDEDFPRSLRILTQQKVSSHYLLSDENPPVIYRLVDENRRAWHAGLSYWQGQTQLNAASIGIEIVNLGRETRPDGSQAFMPYPQAQMDAMVALVKDIALRHGIRPDRILGHSDIAPQRKIDPGPLFPWKRLADEGLIPWPEAERVALLRRVFEARPVDAPWWQQALGRIGYQVPDTGQLDAPTRRVIAAFQMKYRPARYDGEPDAETAALAQALIDAADAARR